ncbi:hypothetical protein [Saccharopolyspora pogona]|uniref:hypothetical protein n=1 Tax=Saccharopolyspora pogona TaxID=333966 RepID=UPI001688DF8B|nr:hypothetical protein [Saccharopolyspora pogona]
MDRLGRWPGPVLRCRPGAWGVAGLADASTAVPDSGQQTVAPDETPAAQTASAQPRSVTGEVQPAVTTTHDVGAGTIRDTGGIPVGQWSPSDLRREIDRASSGLVQRGKGRGAADCAGHA